MTTTYSTPWLNYLVDPITAVPLQKVNFGLAPQNDLNTVYPIHNGIVSLSDGHEREILAEKSAAYDAACRAQGWQAPDHFEFRRLPRSGLNGWPTHYWAQRAFSTAAVWHVLEESRKRKGGLPIGMAGVAAEFTYGLPYMAYGLDVAGYVTCAVSPHVGMYGLGAYPHTRYGRIQAENLPLKPESFDVVVVSEFLPDVIRQAARLLAPTGYLMLTDCPTAEEAVPYLKAEGLQVELQKVKGVDEGLRGLVQKFRAGEIDVPPLLVAHRE